MIEPATSKVIKAALGGVLYDGGRTYPVPLAGVSWVDFDFRKTGTQLSAFFAGPLFVADLVPAGQQELPLGRRPVAQRAAEHLCRWTRAVRS